MKNCGTSWSSSWTSRAKTMLFAQYKCYSLAITEHSALRPVTRAPHAREGLPCTHMFGSCDAYAICGCTDAFLQSLCLPYSTFRYITFHAQQAGRSLGIIIKCVQFASSAFMKTFASLHLCQFHLATVPYRQKHTTIPLRRAQPRRHPRARQDPKPVAETAS